MAVKLSASQQRIAREIVRRGLAQKRGPKAIKAALLTGLVESNFTNSARMTDHDSQGWRQERKSLYKDPTNLEHSIDRFYREAAAVSSKYGTAGALAAAVQRPAAQYRGRYQQRSAEGDALMRQLGVAGGGAPRAAAASAAPAHPMGFTAADMAQAAAMAAALTPEVKKAFVTGGPIELPAFAAQAPQAFQVAGGAATGIAAPQTDVRGVLDTVLAMGDAGASVASPQATEQTVKSPAAASGGKVIVRPGADRDGVGLGKPLVGFLKQVSALSKQPITITTGTRHKRLSGSGLVSDHWAGNGADLGLGGDGRQNAAIMKKGDLIAAHAIRAATGMGFKKSLALARKGGIHNFNTKRGRVQIIWRVDGEVGNHFNHVHVGVNPGR